MFEEKNKSFITHLHILKNNILTKLKIDSLLNRIIGFRRRNKTNITIAIVYYLFSLVLSISMGNLFLFTLVFTFSVPYVVFSVIDTIQQRNIKKLNLMI